jgi:predicted NAD/FAD-dependent oxidoreductase
MKLNSKTVAVVGAGMSGITTASNLAMNGFHVTVFEKSRGPGGRCATRREKDFRFDHGAQYFTVSNEQFKNQVEGWLDEKIVGEWPARVVRTDGDNLDEVNNRTKLYVGVPGMNAMTKALAQSLNVHYETGITGISFQNSQWHLETSLQVKVDPFDILILSMPPSQVESLLPDHIPAKKYIRKTKMLPCWAVMAIFDYIIPVNYDGAFVSDSALSWICRNNSKPGRPDKETWILHASAEWSKIHLEDSKEQVVDFLMTEFKRITSCSDFKLLFSKAHRWRFAENDVNYGEESVWDSDNQIGLCGDWFSESKIEGAYLSGKNLAQKIFK